MKALKVTKFSEVKNIDQETLNLGIIAFQLVKFEIMFFGSIVESVLDTKIMNDGRQIVIDGDGFIKAGYEL